MIPHPDRRELRSRMRKRRNAVAPAQRIAAGQALSERIAATRWYRNAQDLAAYLPHNGEIDTRPLIARAMQDGKQLWLPVIADSRDVAMTFHSYDQHQALHRHRYGLQQPGGSSRRILQQEQLAQLDLVIVPLLAFDLRGNRLGMGAGYYDEAFGFLRKPDAKYKTVLLAAAFECQRVKQLDTQDWDVRVHAVATEETLHLID